MNIWKCFPFLTLFFSFSISAQIFVLNELDHKPHFDFNNTQQKSFGDQTSLIEAFQTTFDSLSQKSLRPGINAAVFFEDGTLWKDAYGLFSSQDSLETSDLMGMGSITKSFVAVTLLLMQEDGLISMEDPISMYLDNYPNVDSSITIRQLLNHTSGLNDYLNENEESVNTWIEQPDRIWTIDTLMHNFVLEPNFGKGEGWSYSNTNYILAGKVIENVSGRPWYEEIRTRILDPFGLTNTYAYPFESVDSVQFAHPFSSFELGQPVGDLIEGGLQIDGFFSLVNAAGNLVSNPEDLCKFTQMLYSGEILQASSLEDMVANVIGTPAFGIKYGLGSMSYYFPVENYGHNGSVIYQSIAFYFPEFDVAMSFQQNDPVFAETMNDADIYDIFGAFIEILQSQSTVSTEDLLDIEVIKLYPNPVSDVLNLEFSNEQAPHNVSIFDASGQRVFHKVGFNAKHLDVSGLNNGMYWLQSDGHVYRFFKN